MKKEKEVGAFIGSEAEVGGVIKTEEEIIGFINAEIEAGNFIKEEEEAGDFVKEEEEVCDFIEEKKEVGVATSPPPGEPGAGGAATGGCATESTQQLSGETVSQVLENSTENLTNTSTDNGFISDSRDKAENDLRDLAPRPLYRPSFSVPDGLVMDPLAPTALAVSNEFMGRLGSGLTLLRDHGKKVQKFVMKSRKFDLLSKKSWKSVVNVVLVEAKDLPDGPASGSNGLYCKFKLGSETHKSKQVPKSKSTWCERFNLYLYEDNNFEVTVWHKGKQKNFMGRCVIDLSRLEREKTHDLWLELECGYGNLHLLVTVSGSVRSSIADGIPTTNSIHKTTLEKEEFSWYRLDNNWSEVGQLLVTVHGAKGLSALGLSGKADAYCVLELDNSRVQTHTAPGTNEPSWNKTYFFPINDITSTLDVTVYDESIIPSLKGEILGRLSVPLLRINNDDKRWYALKDRSKKGCAKGNCPRILLQMSVVWNPIKASLRVLSPKQNKYTQKLPPKFNIPLIYNNLKFVRDVFNAAYIANEHFKRSFEWENRELCVVALGGWLAFWYFFRIWMAPLLALVPFFYYWSGQRASNNSLVISNPGEDDFSDDDLLNHRDDKTIKTRLYGLQDLTFTIKNGIDYIVSLYERVKNLFNFTVPYLSYLAMTGMVIAAIVLYLIPFNYILMALGIYKFTRKFLNPDRIPNNDILDFLSRLPDNEMLKQWRELKVPEPNLHRMNSIMHRRQIVEVEVEKTV